MDKWVELLKYVRMVRTDLATIEELVKDRAVADMGELLPILYRDFNKMAYLAEQVRADNHG